MSFSLDFACECARNLFVGRIDCTVNALTMNGAEEPALWVKVGDEYIAAMMPTNYLRAAGWLVGETDGRKLPTFVQHVRDLPTAVDLIAVRWHRKERAKREAEIVKATWGEGVEGAI